MPPFVTPSSTDTPMDGTWQPTVVTSASPTNDYTPYGLPKGMETQRVFLGFQSASAAKPYTGEDTFRENAKPARKKFTENSFTTVKDLLDTIHDMATSPDAAKRTEWAQLQAQLQAMNAYGSSKRINYGGWSKDDLDAVKFALDGYLGGNASKMQSFAEYVANTAAQGAANGLDTGGTGTQPNPISYTNPADLNAALDNQSSQLLGHGATSGQQAFIDQYHGEETAAGQAQGNYTSPATPADAAKQFVVQNNLPEYAAHQVEGYMNAFVNMFLGGASARAQTSTGDVAVGG